MSVFIYIYISFDSTYHSYADDTCFYVPFPPDYTPTVTVTARQLISKTIYSSGYKVTLRILSSYGCFSLTVSALCFHILHLHCLNIFDSTCSDM